MSTAESIELKAPKQSKANWPLTFLALTCILAVLGCIIAGQLWATRTWSLLSRHLWLDEIYTCRLVADADLGHAMRALASGVETHPPTFYLLLRGFTRWPGANDVTLRLFSIVALLVALAGLYVWLRVDFPWEVAAATVLLIWSHHSVLTQSFNARSYTLWLAAAVWFAYLLWRSRIDTSMRTWLLLAMMAALLCTVHWFGIISLVLITAFELWDRTRNGLMARRGMVAVGLGILVGVCCLPFLILQRSATSVPTWLPETQWRTLIGFFEDIYHLHVMVPLALIALAAAGLRATGLGRLAGRQFTLPNRVGAVSTPEVSRSTPLSSASGGRGQGEGGNLRNRNGTSQFSLLGLLVMPLLLVGFSYFGQNVLVERYSFPTIAALAPVAAILFAKLSRPWLVVCAIILVALTSLELVNLAADWDKWDREIDQLAVTIIRDTGSEDVLFESPAQLYPLCRYARPLAARCHLLDFDAGDIGRITSDRLFMRDLARRYAQFYPTPSLVKWTELRRRNQVFLVPHAFAGTPAASAAQNPYPGFRVQPVGRRLVLLVADGDRPAAGGK